MTAESFGLWAVCFSLPSGIFCVIASNITHALKVSDKNTLAFHIFLRKSTLLALLSD